MVEKKSYRKNIAQVKRGAMSYRITDSMNALAMPKKMYDPNEKKRASPTRASTLRPDNELAGKLKPLIRSPKNNLNLDTYAAMVLKNDIQCPTRIKKLARPKGQASSNNDTMDFF